MQFEVKNLKKSINDVMRKIGYKPAYFQKEEEVSIVRQIGRNDYPRFHLYIKEIRPIDQSMCLSYIFNLHLDQKKPSYKGSKGHSGEYDGKVVEDEAERIKNILIF